MEDKIFITDREWDDFVNTGHVDDEVLEVIAMRIIGLGEGETLTKRETAIYDQFAGKVEDFIKKL